MTDVRATMLSVISAKTKDSRGLTRSAVLDETDRALRNDFPDKTIPPELGLEILDAWDDLYRSGVLGWGSGLGGNNISTEFAHLTVHGLATMGAWSRDPSNPNGYLNGLRPHLDPKSIAWSYAEEAVRAYNAGCHRAAAVLVGAASESLALTLRDALVARMSALSKPKLAKLDNWMIKIVLDAMNAEFDRASGTMPKDGLEERRSSHWPALTGEIRRTRNDAGHPSSVSPVTFEVAHASLLIFPEVARLAKDLGAWVATSYT